MTLDIPVYVAHYDKAPERKAYLTKALKDCGFSEAHFNSLYCERSKIYNQETIKLVDTSNLLCKRKFARAGMRSGYHAMSPREPAYLGNFLNHISIWQQIAEGEHEHALVLEDDAVITNQQVLRNQIENLPTDIDIGYLHAGCGFTLEKYYGIIPRRGELWVKTPERLSRTMCTYILSRSAAKRILEIVFPISWAIDHEINYLQNILHLNVYWTNEHGLSEGSSDSSNTYKSLFR
jgi:GR25 family glycosyltransferase involved in LPS biosynthesis